jgi:hypothetical protein
MDVDMTTAEVIKSLHGMLLGTELGANGIFKKGMLSRLFW